MLRHSVVSDSLRPHGPQPARLLCPWNSPGKNTGVGSHSFLQEIFPAQGSKLGLLHCRQIPYHLRHQGPSNKLASVIKKKKKEIQSFLSWLRWSVRDRQAEVIWPLEVISADLLFCLRTTVLLKLKKKKKTITIQNRANLYFYCQKPGLQLPAQMETAHTKSKEWCGRV